MLDPVVVKTIATGLGLMFLIASVHKFSDNAQFRVTLLEYQLLPERFVAPFSRIVPIGELLLGASWLVGFNQQVLTAVASAGLLALYAIAISINLKRGRVHFDCGCGFGGKTDNEQYLSGGLVIRNLLLMALALVTLLPAGSRELGIGDYATLTAALLACTLLFGAANQLLANRSAINTWRNRK
jgi:hypothetical protein